MTSGDGWKKMTMLFLGDHICEISSAINVWDNSNDVKVLLGGGVHNLTIVESLLIHKISSSSITQVLNVICDCM